MFIAHLPQDSWTQTALRDAPRPNLPARPVTTEQRFGPWALVNYQLADLRDAIAHLTYVSAIAGELSPKPKPPTPTPRPGMPSRAARAMSPKAAAYLNGLRAKGG